MKNVKEDLDNKKCSEFENDGYQCVPFFACKDGEIVTNGIGILATRGNLILIINLLSREKKRNLAKNLNATFALSM